MKIKFENKEELCYYANKLDRAFGCPRKYENLALNINCQSTSCVNCWYGILKNLSEKDDEKIPVSEEKQFTLKELYAAVCMEHTLYGEHDDLNNRAEDLKKDIFYVMSYPCNNIMDNLENHTIPILKELLNNWETINWVDDDKDLIERIRKDVVTLLEDFEKNMYQPENMKSVLLNVADAADGIYNALFRYTLEECKSERDYYGILAFIRQIWEDISWKQNLVSHDENVKKPKEPEDEVIRHFIGKYAFLSNAYESEFEYKCIPYKNAEAAYQASKTEHDTIRKLFSDMDAKEARKTGKTLVIHDSWDRLAEMRGAVWAKFFQSPELTELLKDTKDAVLAPEGIGTFWGMKDGKGENHLGKILMDVRDQLFAMECEFSKEIEEFFKAIDDYEKGVINVDRMTSATANLAKCLIEGEHALLIADLSEVLEESENVPKALYDMMRKYKEKCLHFLK